MSATVSLIAVHRTIAVGGITGLKAAIFDFNGTITDDEDMQYDVYAETLAELGGLEFEREHYFGQLAGRCDHDLIRGAFVGCGQPIPPEAILQQIVRSRIDRYLARASMISPVRPETAELVMELSTLVPLAIVSGAPSEEVESVLRMAGLLDRFDAVVCCDDVSLGKPSPEGFLLALDKICSRYYRIRPHEVVVFEDSVHGIAAARNARMHCIAAHLQRWEDGEGADLRLDRLDVGLLRCPGTNGGARA
jgi:HAD superfamily hydrolase (TIGR01509 family)